MSGALSRLHATLLRTMWNELGVVRNREEIAAGLAKLDQYGAELREIGVADGDRAFNPTWHDWLNLESLIEVSKVIGVAAMTRENSRGAHFRQDYPEPGDLASSAYTVVHRRDGQLQAGQKPVAFTIVRPGSTLVRDETAEQRATA